MAVQPHHLLGPADGGAHELAGRQAVQKFVGDQDDRRACGDVGQAGGPLRRIAKPPALQGLQRLGQEVLVAFVQRDQRLREGIGQFTALIGVFHDADSAGCVAQHHGGGVLAEVERAATLRLAGHMPHLAEKDTGEIEDVDPDVEDGELLLLVEKNPPAPMDRGRCDARRLPG